MENYAEAVLPGKGASDYERYLRTDDLLALQKTPQEMVHRDELLFQTVHQSSELWLKLACFEIQEAAQLIPRQELGAALRLLRRATQCLHLITSQIHMLAHLSPWEYQTIRRVLGHGSGFDSPGFKALLHSSPALGEAFRALLKNRNLSVVELYRRGREFEDLYQIAELLIEWDEQVALWKFHHFKLVERIIGGRAVGTQGTAVEVLGQRIREIFYPDLWEARNELTRIAKAEEHEL